MFSEHSMVVNTKVTLDYQKIITYRYFSLFIYYLYRVSKIKLRFIYHHGIRYIIISINSVSINTVPIFWSSTIQ